MKIRHVVALAAVVALSGCTNDYDQFSVEGSGGSAGAGGQETGGSVTGGSAGEGQAGSGGMAGDASAEGGTPHDGPIDVTADGDAHADAPADAGAEADALSAADASPEADAPADVSPDVPDVNADRPPDVKADVADASEAGSTEDVIDAGSGEDVIDSSVPEVEPPDVSVTDAQDAADVSMVEEDGSADVSVEAPCGAGTKLCNGTCVPLDDPAHGCASSACSPCPALAHTTGVVCDAVGGTCAIAGCQPQFDDCDGIATNGCETSLQVDVENCGACRRACSVTSVASRQCIAGLCVPSCTLNSASCTAPPPSMPDDGCERFVATDTNCGGCDNNCTAQGAAAGLSCGLPADVCQCTRDDACGGVSGACNGAGRCKCGGATCQAGEACRTVGAGDDAGADAGEEADAEDDAADGEGIDAETEAASPGTDICSCNAGAACAAGQTCCQTPGGCFDLATDVLNCGACGRRCAAGLSCMGGVCRCSADPDCNAGSGGTCRPSGQCECSRGGVCDPGRRCQADGSCG